jgi:hypothetical protein
VSKDIALVGRMVRHFFAWKLAVFHFAKSRGRRYNAQSTKLSVRKTTSLLIETLGSPIGMRKSSSSIPEDEPASCYRSSEFDRLPMPHRSLDSPDSTSGWGLFVTATACAMWHHQERKKFGAKIDIESQKALFLLPPAFPWQNRCTSVSSSMTKIVFANCRMVLNFRA